MKRRHDRTAVVYGTFFVTKKEKSSCGKKQKKQQNRLVANYLLKNNYLKDPHTTRAHGV
jgi:hypothetical protein